MQLITISQMPEGLKRKDLVKELASLMGTESKYLGVPSCAYQIGNIKVLKDDKIEVSDEATKEEIVALMTTLSNLNIYSPEYTEVRRIVEIGEQNAEQVEIPSEEISEAQEEAENTEEPIEEVDTVCIQVPDDLDEGSWQNLINLSIAKGELISKALGIEDAVIKKEDGAISFPWVVGDISPIRIEAATELVCRMVKMAKEQKRINANEKPAVNEKYAFRCFLLRLGFIGKDARIKAIRKELLKNLQGSSAFRQPKEEVQSA